MIGETKLKILSAALTPSRYTDLAKVSGVSKTMFDRHLDDLIEDGLIEKTEDGLYVITAKGIELLLRLKANEQQSLIDKIKKSFLPSKKEVSEEVKHCWFEIGRLYTEYLLQIKELAVSQIKELVNDENFASFIVDWENIIGMSHSLGVYIIGRLREYVGRFSNPIADILRKFLTFKSDMILTLPPDYIKFLLDVAEGKLDLILNEVERLVLLSNDRELKLSASYLKFKLEDLKTYITRVKKYLIEERQ